MAQNKNLIITSGRRKTATASVFMKNEKGDIKVNDKNIETYFPSEKESLTWKKPFYLLGIAAPEARFDISVKVSGSSKSSQLGAVTLAISKALSLINDEFSLVLKKNGMLTRDPRMVERKKPNLRKARKSAQFSKR
ncbi:30S ribosomal protein S9 [bacterium]|nr:30S ribosomal protein S9 [bacterium]